MGITNSMAFVSLILLSMAAFGQTKNSISNPTSPLPAGTPKTTGVKTSLDQRSYAIGFLGWPEKIKITDEFGVSHDANVQFYTPSIHYTRRDVRARFGYLYEGYVFFGKADVQNEPATTLTYFQKRVGVYGIGGLIGYFLRPATRQISIGVAAPIQYRKASFTNPPIGGNVGSKDLLAIGYMLDLRWRINSDMAVTQRVGQFFGQPPSLWMFQLDWTL